MRPTRSPRTRRPGSPAIQPDSALLSGRPSPSSVYIILHSVNFAGDRPGDGPGGRQATEESHREVFDRARYAYAKLAAYQRVRADICAYVTYGIRAGMSGMRGQAGKMRCLPDGEARSRGPGGYGRARTLGIAPRAPEAASAGWLARTGRHGDQPGVCDSRTPGSRQRRMSMKNLRGHP